MILFSSIVLFISYGAFALDARYESQSSSPELLTTQAAPYPTGSPTRVYGNSTALPEPTGSASCAPYWMENTKHQGLSPFNTNSNGTYRVFRNVKDYGAVGDGVTDDTSAIQRAITEGDRCAPGVCQSSTRTPAVVYFPGGTYLISASIIDYYYTQVGFNIEQSSASD